MVKQIIPAIAIIFLLGSCSTLKPLNFISYNQPASVSVAPANKPVKFIDEIAVSAQSADTKKEIKKDIRETAVKEESKQNNEILTHRSREAENVSALQLKYAELLNTNAEQLQNKALLEGIDEWYGTRYRMGGTTKQGIDCSAFVGTIYLSVFGVSLPRTAKDQYHFSSHISRTELQEGDLLFFNTRGGVSHVGIYLQNNKFVHASTVKGVTISDMFEPYYLQHFIGAGRIKNKQGPVALH
jgi:cell wall-associated NlpC family hydrolase